MSFTPLKIPGSGILETDVFSDNRGSFEVFWEQELLDHAGIPFIPANAHHSYNLHKKTLRGLHYQLTPFAQDKLVSCVNGAVYDVMVDMRENSPTFLQWVAVTLTASCGRAVFIPAGCAHGFVTLEPNTTIAYLISGQFNPAAAATVRWDDPAIGIDWPVVEGSYTISARDKDAPFLHI